jgi:hypothetical protein
MGALSATQIALDTSASISLADRQLARMARQVGVLERSAADIVAIPV